MAFVQTFLTGVVAGAVICYFVLKRNPHLIGK